MGDYEALTLAIDDGVATLTLCRPEKRNAMTPALTRDFPAAIAAIRADPAIRALVLGATGPVFCAGGDLAMLERMTGQAPDENYREMRDFYARYLALLDLEIPTIAALGGHAVGAGAALALACDFRLLATEAQLSFPFLALGLHPGMGTTHLLPHLAGHSFAADLLLSGRRIGADEALACGLVSRVLPAAAIDDAAAALARELAGRAPGVTLMTKRTLVAPKIAGLDAALDREALAQAHSYASAEMRAALAAIRDRARR